MSEGNFFKYCFFILITSLIALSSKVQRNFIPEYNDGSRITITNGDTAMVFSVKRDVDPKKADDNKYYYYFKNNNINKTKGSFTGKLQNPFNEYNFRIFYTKKHYLY